MAETLKGEDLIKRLIWDDEEGYETVDTLRGDKRRWATGMSTIVKRLSDGKLFQIDWDEAATESQEHEYPDEAYEVIATQTTKVITEYRPCPDPATKPSEAVYPMQSSPPSSPAQSAPSLSSPSMPTSTPTATAADTTQAPRRSTESRASGKRRKK